MRRAPTSFASLRRAGRVLVVLMLSVGTGAVALVVTGTLADRWRVVPVLSGSMRPSIVEGAAVVAVPAPLSSVERGDVIVYTPPGATHLLMHRVVEVVEPGPRPVVRTKGDANRAVDPWRARLAGTAVWKVRAVVPWWGRVVLVAGRPAVRFAMIAAAAALVAIVGLRAIWAAPERRPSPSGDRRHASAST
jgi:signal peptidase